MQALQPGVQNDKTNSNFGFNINSFQLVEGNELRVRDFIDYYQEELEYFSGDELKLRTFFEQRISFTIDNVEIGTFSIAEDFVRAEGETVNLYLNYANEVIFEEDYQKEYPLEARTERIDLQGLFIGGRLYQLENEIFNINFYGRLKGILAGDIEKRDLSGRARVESPFIYQSGYRSIIVNRDSDSRARGLSLDFELAGELDPDLLLATVGNHSDKNGEVRDSNIGYSETDTDSKAEIEKVKFSAAGYNLLDYIRWNDVYKRKLYDGSGYFEYQDYVLGINPRYSIEAKYKRWELGLDYLRGFYPRASYEIWQEGVSVRPGIHGRLFSLELEQDYFSLALKTNRLNLLEATDISLSVNVGFSF